MKRNRTSIRAMRVGAASGLFCFCSMMMFRLLRQQEPLLALKNTAVWTVFVMALLGFGTYVACGIVEDGVRAYETEKKHREDGSQG